MVSTPAGLFIGTANPFGPKVAARFADGWKYVLNPDGGAEIWLGVQNHNGANGDVLEKSRHRYTLIAGANGQGSKRPRVFPAERQNGRAKLKDSLPPHLKEVERAWRVAARQATDASFKYHLIRVLSAVARRTFVSASSLEEVPEWAKEVWLWEGNQQGGAAQRAGIEALKGSLNFHIASARREVVRAHLAVSISERHASLKRYRQHLRSVTRASRRLARVLSRNRGNLISNGNKSSDSPDELKFAGDVMDFYDR